MRRIRTFIITTIIGGLVLILPIVIFVFMVQFLIGLVRKVIKPLSVFIGNEFDLEVAPYVLDVLSITIVIAFCFLVGLIIRTQLGKNFFGYFERTYLFRLPLYSTIKETVQQFSGQKKMPFSEVVLVDVFGNGTRMTGFITDEHESGMVTVFVPTGPNPTNGFIFHVNRDQVRHVDAGSEDAMRTIIGIGVGSSDEIISKTE